jgi:MFS family permease
VRIIVYEDLHALEEPAPWKKTAAHDIANGLVATAKLGRHMTTVVVTKAVRSLTLIPAGVWTLGFVSLLMDFSSEMMHGILPLYLVSALGTPMLAVGAIEGIAEGAALIVKIFSGALSDWLGKRKLLAAFGYGLAAFTKPIFPLASTAGWLFAARFIDRIGKGIRGAPRDALVADLSPPELRGASFGLRQSLDTIGAFAGPLLAIAIMWQTANNFTAVFWVAVIPAFLSFLLIAFAMREPQRSASLRRTGNPISRSELSRLSAAYWWLTGIGGAFSLARFSEAFLILKAQEAGLPIALGPAVLVAMNVFYAFSAYPAGVLADRTDRRTIVTVGIAVLIAADLVLAGTQGMAGVILGVIIWGLHMGLTQGLLAALVADVAPLELRGTAFGMFNLSCGIGTLLASIVAGALWDTAGSQAVFLAGGVFALLALLGLFAVRNHLPKMAIA